MSLPAWGRLPTQDEGSGLDEAPIGSHPSWLPEDRSCPVTDPTLAKMENPLCQNHFLDTTHLRASNPGSYEKVGCGSKRSHPHVGRFVDIHFHPANETHGLVGWIHRNCNYLLDVFICKCRGNIPSYESFSRCGPGSSQVCNRLVCSCCCPQMRRRRRGQPRKCRGIHPGDPGGDTWALRQRRYRPFDRSRRNPFRIGSFVVHIHVM